MKSKWIERLALTIRIFLAIVFISYGFVKLLGGQFYYGDWTISKSTASGPFLVWAFYGYSPFYGHIMGLFELIPALMLLFRRTATAGAAALFAVSLNIAIMDFGFDFPSVKYACAFYTLLCVILLALDYKRLLLFVATPQETTEAFTAASRYRMEGRETRRRVSRRALALGIIVLVPFLIFVLNLLGTALDPGPQIRAQAALVARGFKETDLELVRSRIHGAWGINRTAEVYFRLLEAKPPRMLEVDAIRPNGFVSWKVTKIQEEVVETQ